jgi:hypothetical protein
LTGRSGAETALVLARAAGRWPPRSTQTGGRVGFFLHTDDFDRDHAGMRARGVAFEEDPRDEAYGRVAVWRDPFGNRWDLIGPPIQPGEDRLQILAFVMRAINLLNRIIGNVFSWARWPSCSSASGSWSSATSSRPPGSGCRTSIPG